ncbi:S1 family peptidase [Streptomyces sp. NPDC049881]|uniref:S1 family peptidase n=1 Tax=Streptomyces sp. NPDC049881 TaxID=3155778 RepID=UPI00341467FD
MRRSIAVRLSLSALLVTGTLVGTGAATATAGGEGSAAQPLSAGLLSALQRDLGLSPDEARTRLAQEADAAETEPAAREAAGDAYGGSWFDPARGTLVVAVTDTGRADDVRATGAEPRLVTHTDAELDATVTALDRLDAPASVASWRIDPRANSVVVTLVTGAERDAATEDFLAAARAAGPVTVSATTTRAPETFAAGTVGGDPWYTGNVRCSIGFSVHGGFVTAGHCGRAGQQAYGWDRSLIGQIQGSSWPGNDYAFVSVGNGWWTVPVVLGWGTVPDVLVRGSAEAPVGASVCRSGSTTRWHCGTVLGKNETVNYSSGEVVYQLTRTSVCAEPGDSGGSYISGDQAQGVTSGGWGNCASGGQTWHQPVNEILGAYGLTLHTA